MSTISIKKIRSSFVYQHDNSDCGAACLLSIIKFYNGNSTFERVRELSGTNSQGSSLLGLYQGANQMGFNAEGCEADIKSLIEHEQPVILHITLDKVYQHFVICYGYNGNKFIIGDPASGIKYWSINELEQVWLTKACLILRVNEKFKKAGNINQLRRAWFYQLLKNDLGVLWVCIVLGIIVAAMGMALAIFSQKLIDVILPSKDHTKLLRGLILLMIILFFRTALISIRQYLLFRQGKEFNNRIIKLFYDSLLYLPKVFFDNRKIGDLVARLNDTRRIQTVISQVLGSVIIDFLLITVSLIFITSYSWQLAVISIISIPILFLIMYSHNKKIIKNQQEVMIGYSTSESNFINTMLGISTIKNFNKQDIFSKLNQKIYSLYQDKIFNLGQINVRLGWLSGISSIILILCIIGYGSILVINEELKLGELMAVLTISSAILPAIAELALITIPINEAKVAFNRMFEFVSIEPETKVDNNIGEFTFNYLELDNISFRYVGSECLLNNISLKAYVGGLISITGESGCGKSTLCQIIEKFYRVENGKILINGTILFEEVTPENWRSILGVVSQDIYLFNGNVIENIALGDENVDINSIKNFCKEFGFDKYINDLPQNYLTIIGEEGVNLSGGQKQIIALARALYKKPKLLILDEATSSMDKNTEQFILDLLLSLKYNMSIIFVSHRLHILPAISDIIYVFDKGKIAVSGTHLDLMKSSNIYSDYWNDIYNMNKEL